MQRVRYSEYEEIAGRKREGSFRATHKLVDKGLASLIKFGVDFHECENGVGNYSTAIILIEGGQIKNIPVEQVQFV